MGDVCYLLCYVCYMLCVICYVYIVVLVTFKLYLVGNLDSVRRPHYPKPADPLAALKMRPRIAKIDPLLHLIGVLGGQHEVHTRN